MKRRMRIIVIRMMERDEDYQIFFLPKPEWIHKRVLKNPTVLWLDGNPVRLKFKEIRLFHSWKSVRIFPFFTSHRGMNASPHDPSPSSSWWLIFTPDHRHRRHPHPLSENWITTREETRDDEEQNEESWRIFEGKLKLCAKRIFFLSSIFSHLFPLEDEDEGTLFYNAIIIRFQVALLRWMKDSQVERKRERMLKHGFTAAFMWLDWWITLSCCWRNPQLQEPAILHEMNLRKSWLGWSWVAGSSFLSASLLSTLLNALWSDIFCLSGSGFVRIKRREIRLWIPDGGNSAADAASSLLSLSIPLCRPFLPGY